MENKIIISVIGKFFSGKPIDINEMTEFLDLYFRTETGKVLDGSALTQLVQSNLFNIDHIIERIASNPVYKIQINRLYGRDGQFIRGDIFSTEDN